MSRLRSDVSRRTGVPDPKLKEFNESSLSQAEVALAPGEVMVIARDTASSRLVSVLTNLEIRAGREHSVLLFPASGDQLAALPKEIVERRVPR